MRRRAPAVLLTALALLCCIDPSDRRPGTWLSGEVVEVAVGKGPKDWTFTDAEKEIAIEVATPYGIAHSVTIWCAALDGTLYVGARDPASKRWPAWADDDPNVRLGIGGKIFPVRLVPLEELEDAQDLVERVRGAYARKYELPPVSPDAPPGSAPVTRYWRVEPRG